MSKVTTAKDVLHIVYMSVGIVASIAGASVVYFKEEERADEKINVAVPQTENKGPIISQGKNNISKDTVVIIQKEEHPENLRIKENKPEKKAKKEFLETENKPMEEKKEIIKEEKTQTEENLFGITRNKKTVKDSTKHK